MQESGLSDREQRIAQLVAEVDAEQGSSSWRAGLGLKEAAPEGGAGPLMSVTGAVRGGGFSRGLASIQVEGRVDALAAAVAAAMSQSKLKDRSFELLTQSDSRSGYSTVCTLVGEGTAADQLPVDGRLRMSYIGLHEIELTGDRIMMSFSLRVVKATEELETLAYSLASDAMGGYMDLPGERRLIFTRVTHSKVECQLRRKVRFEAVEGLGSLQLSASHQLVSPPARSTLLSAAAALMAQTEVTVTVEERKEMEKAAGRQVRRERLGLGPLEMPAEFTCPITFEQMADPVVASDGNTYEREAIEAVIRNGNGLSPLTREPLLSNVFPNRALRNRSEEYEEEMIQQAERAVAADRAWER